MQTASGLNLAPLSLLLINESHSIAKTSTAVFGLSFSITDHMLRPIAALLLFFRRFVIREDKAVVVGHKTVVDQTLDDLEEAAF